MTTNGHDKDDEAAFIAGRALANLRAGEAAAMLLLAIGWSHFTDEYKERLYDALQVLVLRAGADNEHEDRI